MSVRSAVLTALVCVALCAGATSAQTPPPAAAAPGDSVSSLPRDTSATPAAPSAGALSPSGSFWRSVVLPGWGQFHNGRPVRGVVYAGLIAGCAGMAVRNWDLAVGGTGGSGAESLFLSGRAWAKGRNNWIILGAFVYSLCILDAYVDAHLQTFDVEPLMLDAPEQPGDASAVQGLRVGVRVPLGRR